MKHLAFGLLATIALAACDNNETECRQMSYNETCNGGNSDYYTCDNSSSCFESRAACEASSDCG